MPFKTYSQSEESSLKYIKRNWDKALLLLIIAVTSFLSLYAIGQEGYSNQYYAAAVKSMLSSWHNFFFASFDPGGYVTVDKPAFGLWLQAASAFIFGFKGWSIILPEVLSAVISVALLFHIVARRFGKAAGVVSAFILGLTPILIAVSRTNNLDSSLVMVLLFAGWALIVAAEKGSLGLLVLSMTLVGLGFNIKMLQAFLVLPAFYLIYLFVSPLKISKRIVHLAAATSVLAAVSLSWAVAVDLTPEDKRPYVGGSETNSVLELALGYNGLQRLTGSQFMNEDRNIAGYPPNKGPGLIADEGRRGRGPGAVPGVGPGVGPAGGPGAGPAGGPGAGPGGAQENGEKSVFRLLNKNLSGQISWFLPMALFGILILSFMAFNIDICNNKDVIRYLLFFSAWIVPMLVFFSIAGFFHRYYLVLLAPGIAALAGIGIVEMWRAYSKSDWKWLLLPLSLAATAAFQVIILSRHIKWSFILIPVVGAISLLSCAVLISIRLLKKESMTNFARFVLIAALVALLAAPAAWSYTPAAYGLQSVLPAAGPDLAEGNEMGRNGNGGNILKDKEKPGKLSTELVKFLVSNYNGERYLVAVPDAGLAESIILDTGKGVMAVGGFSGTDDILTVERLGKMVDKGELRYYYTDGRGMGQSYKINEWVTEHGKEVSIDCVDEDFEIGGGVLYDLAPEKD